MSDKPKSEILTINFALVVLGLISLLTAKFLWAFTLWYEWIALGIGIALLYAAGVFGFDKHKGNADEKRSDGE